MWRLFSCHQCTVSWTGAFKLRLRWLEEEIKSKDEILRLGLSKEALNGYEDEKYLFFAYSYCET